MSVRFYNHFGVDIGVRGALHQAEKFLFFFFGKSNIDQKIPQEIFGEVIFDGNMFGVALYKLLWAILANCIRQIINFLDFPFFQLLLN